jgi:dTDP-4-dehydrorhamnose reductase
MTARVLITGAGAQLASPLRSEFSGAGALLALGHPDLDISDPAAVGRCVADFKPTLILNCASYNDVDRAEDDPQGALHANAFGVRVLARAAVGQDAALVHYSTDFVFDGRACVPYTEEDAPRPASVYASSKLLGEWFALEAPRGYVLRVASLFGGVRAKSSVDRIVDAILEGREARVFSDRTLSPSYVCDVAAATRAVVAHGTPGLYHCVGTGCCTWLELAREAARLLGREHEARLIPVLMSEVPLRAVRPKFAALSNAKLSAIAPMPSWQDALARYVAHRRAGLAHQPGETRPTEPR